MKKVAFSISIAFVGLLLSVTPEDAEARGSGGRGGSSGSGRVSVRGYHRSDGTYVSPHTRSAPGSGGGYSGYGGSYSGYNNDYSYGESYFQGPTGIKYPCPAKDDPTCVRDKKPDEEIIPPPPLPEKRPIFKCTASNGKETIQDTVCPQGTMTEIQTVTTPNGYMYVAEKKGISAQCVQMTLAYFSEIGLPFKLSLGTGVSPPRVEDVATELCHRYKTQLNLP